MELGKFCQADEMCAHVQTQVKGHQAARWVSFQYQQRRNLTWKMTVGHPRYSMGRLSFSPAALVVSTCASEKRHRG